jgi:hypothetical protein
MEAPLAGLTISMNAKPPSRKDQDLLREHTRENIDLAHKLGIALPDPTTLDREVTADDLDEDIPTARWMSKPVHDPDEDRAD